MCGISGELSFEGQANHDAVKAMMVALKHRGRGNNFPYRIEPELSIGFNYLAIQDVSARPLIEYGNWLVCMNGEVYNHNELRKTLQAEFTTASDTETVAAGLSVKGIEFIKELNGIFAIVAWNAETKKLYIFRDRFGAKQIYYSITNDGLLFASEPKAFLKHPSYKFAINKSAVSQWLVYQNNFQGETLFDNIKLLRKGSFLMCDGNGTCIHKSFHEFQYSGESCETGNEQEVFNLLSTSTMIQRPKEDFAGWLSGGLDSALIARFMKPQYLVTAGWSPEEVDERKDAERISRELDSIHIGMVFNKRHMAGATENTIRHLDDLRAGHSWSNYLINKHLSKHVRITVQGTGADELFGGYPWRYSAEDYSRILDKTQMPDGFLKEQLYIPKIPKTIMERYQWDVDHFLNGLLIVGDRLSSAFGIEERVPFLDNRLAEYALRLSPEVKQNKSILRNATNSYDISTIKRGFGSPDKLWMSDEHIRKGISEELKGSQYLPDFVDMDMLDSIIEQRNYPAVWSLLALHYWIKIYADGK